jgi:tRNA1Val (adenine37-N6)-methyltransferase
MANTYFQFKQFTIHQDRCAMKVTTDACLFGAWVAERVGSLESLVDSREPGIMKMLDIGTGTGLLTMMLAQKTNYSIDAIEIDKDAFEQARENALASSWAERIHISHADVSEFISPSPYDIILCNPPFYENELTSPNNKKNIARHGQHLLFGELLLVIKKTLAASGIFFLLLPFKRNEEIRNLLLQHNFDILQMTFVRQSVHQDYFRILLMGKQKSGEPEETMIDEISIWDEQQQYTEGFKLLLKDYYLNL